MDRNLEIRMATTSPEDIDILHEYIYKLGVYQRMNETNCNIDKETLTEQIGNKTLESCIAFLNGKAVGVGLFYTLASGFTGGTSMFLNIYYVDEDKREQAKRKVCDKRKPGEPTARDTRYIVDDNGYTADAHRYEITYYEQTVIKGVKQPQSYYQQTFRQKFDYRTFSHSFLPLRLLRAYPPAPFAL